MRTMAGHTAPGTEDPVHLETTLAVIKIFFLVFMTDHAQSGLTICPELKFIGTAVGIMTDSAVTGADRPMDVGHRGPFVFINMAIEAETFNPADRYRYLLFARISLVTGIAEQG